MLRNPGGGLGLMSADGRVGLLLPRAAQVCSQRAGEVGASELAEGQGAGVGVP
jgi:hypothetical protein